MRSLLVAITATAVLAVPAAAADVNPKALVLPQSEFPAGFRLDPPNTMVLSNQYESRTSEARTLIARSGRLTGYRVTAARTAGPEFRLVAAIESRADLFRQAEGARYMLRWFDRDLRDHDPNKRLERLDAGIGVEAWVYTSIPGLTLVVWRHGRVFARVTTIAVSRKQTLALARKQQRRIAAALR